MYIWTEKEQNVKGNYLTSHYYLVEVEISAVNFMN
jgi:hypothetical protein